MSENDQDAAVQGATETVPLGFTENSATDRVEIVRRGNPETP